MTVLNEDEAIAEGRSTAVLSACGAYRYRLGRRWGREAPLCFVMLNPSTADDNADDPTIRKCIGFAMRLGFGSIDVVNLFAYRATDPRELRRAGFQIGPHNDGWIDIAVRETRRLGGEVVCAWGAHARGLARPAQVLDRIIRHAGVQPMVLERCADGTPSHPLMLPYTCRLSVLDA